MSGPTFKVYVFLCVLSAHACEGTYKQMDTCTWDQVSTCFLTVSAGTGEDDMAA